jgi:hypothetical protein
MTGKKKRSSKRLPSNIQCLIASTFAIGQTAILTQLSRETISEKADFYNESGVRTALNLRPVGPVG